MTDNHKKEPLLFCFKKYGVLPTIRTRLRQYCIDLRRLYLVKLWGMDIHPHTLISLKANLDRTYPKGIHIGEGSAVSFDCIIFTHDHTRGIYKDTRIGKYCQLGARCIIMPGVTIGDHSVVGSASVVTKDVPPNCIVVGNPAKIIRTGIETTRWGRITNNGISVKS